MYKTMEQVKKEYDGYWVFLVNCTQGEHHSIIGGEVALATKSRAELFEEMSKFGGAAGDTYFFYSGERLPAIGMIL